MKTTPDNPSSAVNSESQSLSSGFWRLADPKISLASFASMLLGACAAAFVGPIDPLWLLATVLGIFAIEVAKNASGEIFDFDSGTDLSIRDSDRSPFSGGKRVLVDGLLTRRETAWIAGVGYAAGLVIGIAIVLLREPGILWMGVAGVACAYFYHAPPLKLSYRGLGEIAVGTCYGPLIALGTFLVQTGSWNAGLLVTSIPLGLLIAAFLWINEFPDAEADRKAGKRTLVVLLGKQRASRVFGCMLLVAFAWLIVLPWFVDLPTTVLLGGIAAVPAFAAAHILSRQFDSTPAIVPAQKLTLLTFVLYAIGCGIGFLMG